MKSGKKAMCAALSVAAILSGAMVMTSAQSAVAAKHEAEKAANPIVEIDTTKGPIKIEVFQKQAPITSANFLDLVNKGFYNGLTFHRYEPGFVIQGGDPNGTGSGNYIDPQTHKERHIRLEKNPALRHNAPGMVAMARTSDPNSASCQFYITLAPAEFLDNPPGYAVFGKVVSGMDNVLKLRGVGSGGPDKMTKVFVVK